MSHQVEEQQVTESRQRLLEVAEELFAHRGFDGTTVREICDRAGMNVAAVNYHFGDKETLFVEAVVEQFIRPMAHGLVGIVGELFPHLPHRRRLMIAFSIVGQCLFYRQNRHVAGLLFGKDTVAALDPDEVADHITTFTLAGLGLGEPYRDPGGAP